MGDTPGNNKGIVQGEVRPAANDAAEANPSLGRQIWDATKREIPGVGAYYHGSDAIDAWNKGDYWSAAGSAYEAAENVIPIGKGVKLARMGLKYGFKQLLKKEVKKDAKKEAKEDAGGAIKKPCKVERYKDLKCDPGSHAHHIIPRFYAKQVGVSDDDGPSVCVEGKFHNKFVHPALNAAVEGVSDHGQISMGKLMAIAIPLATKAADKTGCGPLIAAKTTATFAPHAGKMLNTHE